MVLSFGMSWKQVPEIKKLLIKRRDINETNYQRPIKLQTACDDCGTQRSVSLLVR